MISIKIFRLYKVVSFHKMNASEVIKGIMSILQKARLINDARYQE